MVSFPMNMMRRSNIFIGNDTIEDGILDGVIPNEHDAALEHILKKAAEKGITPVNLP